jgi:GPI mannosyltransferase 3
MPFQTKGVWVYLAFVVFRIANVTLIQSQFDPDEYWQNLEPAYCYVFGRGYHDSLSCQGLTWEWKRRPNLLIKSIVDTPTLFLAMRLGLEQGPVRSFASIVPTMIFYYLLQYFQWDTSWMVSRGPVVLNAILVAATTDWTVWYMSWWMSLSAMKKYNQAATDAHQPRQPQNVVVMSDDNRVIIYCVYCCLTSWFNAYALVRTYSNSLETLLVSLSVALVSPVSVTDTIFRSGVSTRFRRSPLYPQDLFSESNSTGKTNVARACLAFFLGGICSAIRFTCLTIYIPMGVILAFKLSSKVVTISYLVGVCAVFGALGLLSTILLDRLVYGFWAFPLLGNIHFNVIQGETIDASTVH